MAVVMDKVFADWQLPLSERIHSPPWYIPAALGVGLLTTLIPSSLKLARLALAGPVMLYLLGQPNRIDAGEVGANFVGATILGCIFLKWFDFTIWRDPEREFWRVSEDKVKEKEKEEDKDLRADPKTGQFGDFWQRLRWSTSLWSTSRGISWNWEIRNVPSGVRPGYSRIRFIRESIYRLLFCIIGADFIHSCVHSTKYGHAPNRELNLYTDTVFMRTTLAWLMAISGYCALQLPYYVFAILTVATGICRPEQWPPIMGNFLKEAWSVRQVWGKCWHQQARRFITIFSDPLTSALGIRDGTLLARYSKLYISFITTAVVHHAGAYAIGRDTGGMYWLWLPQAVIITFEDLVIYLGKRAGIKDSAPLRVLGTIWSIVWLSQITSLPTAAGVALNQGAGRDAAPLGFADGLFPAALGYDALWKVMLDRLGTYVLVRQALAVIVAEEWEQLVWPIVCGMGAASLSVLQKSCSCVCT